MIGREDKNHNMHWFPRVHELLDDETAHDTGSTKTVVEDDHSQPYIGDFPPKDGYRDGIYD